jgi:hypothetical protein
MKKSGTLQVALVGNPAESNDFSKLMNIIIEVQRMSNVDIIRTASILNDSVYGGRPSFRVLVAGSSKALWHLTCALTNGPYCSVGPRAPIDECLSIYF